ncbi:hypothetical protein D917_05545 [Trichinella nativa]|uniref:Uncharacterized protein n=1 Tax=Trichinella nativa TaxID=6335 RepID=A0A1Y3EWW8_9BILA|nr:hypothetical protein D917_05545 [Trichinella nativa]
MGRSEEASSEAERRCEPTCGPQLAAIAYGLGREDNSSWRALLYESQQRNDYLGLLSDSAAMPTSPLATHLSPENFPNCQVAGSSGTHHSAMDAAYHCRQKSSDSGLGMTLSTSSSYSQPHTPENFLASDI